MSAGQIREVISSYVSKGDADKFLLDFSVLSYNIHKLGNPEAIRLANEIESKLADLRGGFISKSIFLESLRNLIKPSANSYAVLVTYSGSLNQVAVLENPLQGWVGFSDTLRGVGCGSVVPLR